ncbi:MAG: alpha/beta fold hydrolase [Alphaproteobacteria bacterium]
MFDGFERRWVGTGETTIHARIGGAGPPLLLLHGFPQSHVMWHALASRLAARFTVVAADLRGYGDSAAPPGGPDHGGYAKRTMARDMVRLMATLGFGRFALVAHDRGARVAHRLALDHPHALERLALLDIVPTRTLFEATDLAVAMAYEHWFFLAQPAPFPEAMIEAAPIAYLHAKLGGWGTGLAAFAPVALAEYERGIQDPATVHAMCEDYRAAATLDLAHDRADADRRIACPLLVLWGENGVLHRHFDVLATWRDKHAAPDTVQGQALPAGHFLAEEVPDAVLETACAFLSL